jgi:catechol 2,3-dioxygenase-like lactoylglutathione lyase family enzyme
MKIRELGHVVLQVTDLDRSLKFYRDTLGLPVVSQGNPRGRRMAFLSLGKKHHDLALMELAPGAGANDPERAGVMHVAFKVGDDDIELLKEAKARMVAAGVTVLRAPSTRRLSLYSAIPTASRWSSTSTAIPPSGARIRARWGRSSAARSDRGPRCELRAAMS